MGNLHKWFSGSKSKDGKSGWVNVKTGGTCASDEPGEGTPKCVSSSKRDSMTKSERESASRRKKAADPGQQQKSGAAKPTYVSTDKPKTMNKEQFSNWRDDTPEPLINELFGLGKKKEKKNSEGSTTSWGRSYSDARAKARFNNHVKAGNIQKGSTIKFNPKTNSAELVAPPKEKVAGTKYEPPTQPKPESKPPVATKPPSDQFRNVKKTLKSAGENIKNNIKGSSQSKPESTPKSNPYSGKDKLKPQSFSTAVKSGTTMKKSTPSAPGKIVTQQGNQKEQFSNWRDDYVATEHEFIDLIKPEPMVGISETKEGQMKAGREQYKKEKEEGRYGGTKPSNERVAKLMKKLKEETKQDGPEPTTKQTRGAMKNIRSKMNTASHKDPDKKKTKQELAFQKARAKAWGMSEETDHDKEVAKYREQAKKKTTMPKGDVGHDIHKRAVDQYNKQNPSKKVKEEFEISEEDKKGSGSGKKDACYNKVKSSASVWPSAYASGRLVQCRKKGADNYGNSKNEEFSAEGYKGKHGQSDKEAMDSRSDAAKQISGDSKSSGAEYSHRSYRGVGKPAAPGERQKNQGKMTDADRNELAIRKNELKKREAKKKGTKNERFSDWRDDLNLMEGVAAWQRKFVSEESKRELQIRASKGDKEAMKKLHQLRADGKIGKESEAAWGPGAKKDLPEGAAWTRKEGKNKAGGLNEKGRKSYERENPGSDLKAPQPEGGPRKKSFCARMGGMKGPMKDEKGKPTRKALALRKWKC